MQSLVLRRGSVASVERDVARQLSERSRDRVGEVGETSPTYYLFTVCVILIE